MSKPTIKDIAKIAGVSIATVSYVLNNSRTVSDELRDRVIHAIDQTGYSPNEVARSLRQKQTHMIGIIGPSSSDYFYGEMVTAIEDAGYKAGYSVILCNTHLSLEREVEYLKLLHKKRVDGVILILDNNSTDCIGLFLEDKIPVVRYGYPPITGLDIDTIRVDNLELGKTVTQYLLGLGHRKIACITPPLSDPIGSKRFVGYKTALEESGINFESNLVAEGNYLMEGGYRAAYKLLELGNEFTALFAGNDATALGAIRAFRQAGFHIPEDISVVSVDNIPLISYADPPLTSVAIPVYSAGEMVFKFLLDRMIGNYNAGSRDVILKCELVERESCRRLS